ncbi:hypothetical protein PTTG_00275 [Puccinia triticina 1-1 BBBD Race 1]|uniref:Phosphatidylethanolamine-binding protein n=1 Tax=Puccinia triticina (isolate 1-1 / race 1 (BBBD)) TaxID=630390 RepID=A0A180H075_PUCT1|nr:hypothetical protein PTTG_00275 [Puccinia triticina 1-1 BBBD Race 1]
MRSFLAALVMALCVGVSVTRSNNIKRDVCDVMNNDAADDACSMKKAFGGSSVFPQLLSIFDPQAALYVHYAEVIVGGAQQLTPNRVATKPNLSIAFMRGPLSPQARITKPIWIQSGMTVNRNTGALSSSTAPIIPYTSPNPQRGTGTHEYVFLVFQENGAGLWASLKQHPQLRASLSGSMDLKAFRAQAGLQNLVAGSFFKSVHP